MDLVEHLDEDGHASLEAALERYLSAKKDLIETGTRVHGNFISEEFMAEMIEGTVALLQGLTDSDPDAKSLFDRATLRFEKMAVEGGIELADDYLRNLKRRNLDALAGLFPEYQSDLLDEFNSAAESYNQVLRSEFGNPGGREQILEAVAKLRTVELKIGSISRLDYEQRIRENKNRTVDRISGMVLAASLLFAAAQVFDKLPRIKAIVASLL